MKKILIVILISVTNLLCTKKSIGQSSSSNQTILGSFESNAGLFDNSTDDKLSIGAVGKSEASRFTYIGLKGVVREYRGVSNVGVFGTAFKLRDF